MEKRGLKTSTGWFTLTTSGWNWRRSFTTANTSHRQSRVIISGKASQSCWIGWIQWADLKENAEIEYACRKMNSVKGMRLLMEAKQQHLALQRADWALETALHIWLIYMPFLPGVPIKPWLDITDSLMMVQTAAAVSAVSPSAQDWLHEAASPQIHLCKWHKSHEVFISLSVAAQSRFAVIVGKQRRGMCVLLELLLLAPKLVD